MGVRACRARRGWGRDERRARGSRACRGKGHSALPLGARSQRRGVLPLPLLPARARARKGQPPSEPRTQEPQCLVVVHALRVWRHAVAKPREDAQDHRAGRDAQRHVKVGRRGTEAVEAIAQLNARAAVPGARPAWHKEHALGLAAGVLHQGDDASAANGGVHEALLRRLVAGAGGDTLRALLVRGLRQQRKEGNLKEAAHSQQGAKILRAQGMGPSQQPEGTKILRAQGMGPSQQGAKIPRLQGMGPSACQYAAVVQSYTKQDTRLYNLGRNSNCHSQAGTPALARSHTAPHIPQDGACCAAPPPSASPQRP